MYEFFTSIPFQDGGRLVGLFAVTGVERGLLFTLPLVYRRFKYRKKGSLHSGRRTNVAVG